MASGVNDTAIHCAVWLAITNRIDEVSIDLVLGVSLEPNGTAESFWNKPPVTDAGRCRKARRSSKASSASNLVTVKANCRKPLVSKI